MPIRPALLAGILTPGVFLGVMLLLAAAVRLVAFFPTLDDPYLHFRQGDEEFYHRWALDILDGTWGRTPAFHTSPLYAYFLALAYAAGGQSIAYIRLLNLLMGLGSVCLVSLAARHFLKPSAAVLATLLYGLCTAPIFYEWLPEKTSLTLLLTALSFFLIARAGARDTPAHWLLAGLAVGLAALAHTTLLVLVPSGWLHLTFGRARTRAAGLTSVAFFTLGALLGIMPATIHNYAQSRDFVLISYNLGTTFYLGNHAGNRTGRYSSVPFARSNENSEETDFNREAERRAGRALKPSEISGYWVRQGLAEIGDNPQLAARRFWRRIRWALGAEEASDTRTFEFYAQRYPVLGPPLWGFGAVSFLALFGVLSTWRDRRSLVCLLFVVFFAFGLSSVLVYGRYRLPLLVPLSILAAKAPGGIFDLLRRRRWPVVLALGIAAGGIGWFTFGPVLSEYPNSHFTDYNNQGNRYLDLGRLDLAVAEYDKALTVQPGKHAAVPGLFGWLVRQYTARGQAPRAEDLLGRVIARYPNDPEARQRLTEAYRSNRQAATPP